MSGDQPELTLDCRGQRCPLPVIELARRIGDVAVGEVIAVVADDPAAAIDVPAWCRMRGHEYLGTQSTQRTRTAADVDPTPSYLVRRVT